MRVWVAGRTCELLPTLVSSSAFSVGGLRRKPTAAVTSDPRAKAHQSAWQALTQVECVYVDVHVSKKACQDLRLCLRITPFEWRCVYWVAY